MIQTKQFMILSHSSLSHRKNVKKIQNEVLKFISNCDHQTPRKFMLDALNWMSRGQNINYNII